MLMHIECFYEHSRWLGLGFGAIGEELEVSTKYWNYFYLFKPWKFWILVWQVSQYRVSVSDKHQRSIFIWYARVPKYLSFIIFHLWPELIVVPILHSYTYDLSVALSVLYLRYCNLPGCFFISLTCFVKLLQEGPKVTTKRFGGQKLLQVSHYIF